MPRQRALTLLWSWRPVLLTMVACEALSLLPIFAQEWRKGKGRVYSEALRSLTHLRDRTAWLRCAWELDSKHFSSVVIPLASVPTRGVLVSSRARDQRMPLWAQDWLNSKAWSLPVSGGLQLPSTPWGCGGASHAGHVPGLSPGSGAGCPELPPAHR